MINFWKLNTPFDTRFTITLNLNKIDCNAKSLTFASTDCSSFFLCSSNTILRAIKCPVPLLFDASLKKCNYPQLVTSQCGTAIVTTTIPTTTNRTSTTTTTTSLTSAQASISTTSSHCLIFAQINFNPCLPGNLF